MDIANNSPSLEKARTALCAIIDEIDADQPPGTNQVYDAACLLRDRVSPDKISIIVSAWKRQLRRFVEYYSHAPIFAESYYFWGYSSLGEEFLDAVSHYRMMECFEIGDFPETIKSVEKDLERKLMSSILEERSIAYDLWIASRSKTLCKKSSQDLLQKALDFIAREQHEDGWIAPSSRSNGQTESEPSTFHTALGALVIVRLGRVPELLEKGKRAISWLTKHQRDSGAWAHYHTKWQQTRRHDGSRRKPKATVVLIDDLYTTLLAVNAIRQSGEPGFQYTLQKAENWILSQQHPHINNNHPPPHNS